MSDPIGGLSGSGIVYGASQSQGDFDVGTLMMMLSLERADSLEGQLKDQANQMKQVNEQIKMTNFFMAEARGIKDEAGTYSQEKAMYDHFMGEAQEFRGKVAGAAGTNMGIPNPLPCQMVKKSLCRNGPIIAASLSRTGLIMAMTFTRPGNGTS